MTFQIGEVARQTGLTIRTLRHYDALGLLRPSARSSAGYRLYSAADLERLLQIQGLKTLGLTLPEIAQALDDPAYDARQVLQRHIAALEGQIAREQQLVTQLRALQEVAQTGWADVAQAIALTGRVQRRVGRVMQAAQAVSGQINLSSEQLQQLQPARFGDGWETLLSDVFRAVEEGVAPDTPQAHTLASRWQALVAQSTSGNAELARTLGLAYERHLSADLWAAWTFIAQALHSKSRGFTMIQSQIAALADPDKNIRIRAALDLGAAQERSALPELVARLVQEPDFFVREHLTWAVVRMGPDAAPLLTELLEHPSAAARLQAVHALSKMPDPIGAATLSQAVHDPDSEVARKAIFALGQRQQVADLVPLLAALGHTDTEHRTTVSTALAQFGRAALAPLTEALQAPQAEQRAHAAEVLGLLGEPAAAPALGEALSDEVWEVQFAALSALGQLPDAAAEQAIERMVQSKDTKLSAVAQRLLDRRPPPPTLLQQKLRQRRSAKQQV